MSQSSSESGAGVTETTRQTVAGVFDTLRAEIDAMSGGHDDYSPDLALMRLSFETSAVGIDRALDELRRVLDRQGARAAGGRRRAPIGQSHPDQIGLAQTYRQLTAALEDLEVGLRGMLDDSDDATRAAYAQCKQAWDRNVADLADVLNQIGSTAVAAGYVPA